MREAAAITLMLVITVWFFLKEYPSVAGLFVPTCALRRSGLEGVENINYLQAIKRVIGMSDKPLANE